MFLLKYIGGQERY